MGLALTSREIEAFKALPPLPAMPSAPEATGSHARNAVDDFSRAIKLFRKQMATWRAKMIANKRRLADLLAEAVTTQNEEAIAYIRDDLLPIVISQVEKTITDLRGRLDLREDTKLKMAVIAALSTSLGRVMRQEEKLYRQAIASEHDAMVQYYYGLLALQAEADPDSRGGPVFDNADDLIASLRS